MLNKMRRIFKLLCQIYDCCFFIYWIDTFDNFDFLCSNFVFFWFVSKLTFLYWIYVYIIFVLLFSSPTRLQ